MIDSTISHYKILEELGHGGMGVVYKGQDTRLGRFVAIKFLHETWSEDGDSLKRFAQEARAASSLNHPNICTVYDIDEHEGRPFIVMEFLEGATLEQCLADQSLGFSDLFAAGAPVGEIMDERMFRRGTGTDRLKSLGSREIFQVGIQIAMALEAAHSAGMIHRDVKPGNIFLTPNMHVKLLDFGLAKLVSDTEGRESAEETVSARLTGVGVRVGTVAYMSPEQLDGAEVDHRTDTFSLGTVLYEMTARRHPFLARSTNSTIANILREEPPPLSEFSDDVPSGLGRVIRRCLQKAREDRYPSASELLINLREAREHPSAVAQTTSEPEIRMSRSVSRTLFLFMQAGYLALYLAALSFWADIDAVLRELFFVTSMAGVSVVIALALCGIAVRIYLSSAVTLDHPMIGIQFEKLFPFLLVLDAVWAASPLLLVPSAEDPARGLGFALAGMAGLAYLPFSQRTLMRAAYARHWRNSP